LYEALTGQLPFSGSLSAILWAKQHQVPTRPSLLVPSVPIELERLCLQLLALDPARRPEVASIPLQLSTGCATGAPVPPTA
jgi:serine/threonine protein kinase